MLLAPGELQSFVEDLDEIESEAYAAYLPSPARASPAPSPPPAPPPPPPPPPPAKFRKLLHHRPHLLPLPRYDVDQKLRTIERIYRTQPSLLQPGAVPGQMARGTDENRGAYLRDIMEAIRELRGVADEDLAAPRG